MSSAPGCKSIVNRLARLALVAVFFVGAQACKAKPSEQACKDAINNIRRISGQDSSDMGADPVAVIRSCRGNSSKESVECMRVAKRLEDLNACEGDVGDKYFKEEIEATQERMTESQGGQPSDTNPEEGARAEPIEAAPTEAVTPDSPAPAAQTPAENKPATDKPAADKPATDKPATDKPATDKPATDKPATDKPAVKKPAAAKPTANKPGTRAEPTAP